MIKLDLSYLIAVTMDMIMINIMADTIMAIQNHNKLLSKQFYQKVNIDF